MTTTTDVTMARRFREIPARGIVPDEPLVGWRLEGVERGRLFNLDGRGRLRVPRCPLQPRSRFPVPQFHGSHIAPHPDCECGVRLVCRLEDLSAICTPRDHRAERLARELTGRTGHRDPTEIATRIEIALATRSRT